MPTLLLADDSVTIQRVIELTFADEGIRVISVSDGEAAIARMTAEVPDIVLADVGMARVDGYQVASHVKRTPALAHVPVLLLTGAFEPIDEDRARQTGADGVLVKPFEPRQLLAQVRELLSGKKPAGLWPPDMPRVERHAPAAAARPQPAPQPPAVAPIPPAGPRLVALPPKQEPPAARPAPSFDQMAEPGPIAGAPPVEAAFELGLDDLDLAFSRLDPVAAPSKLDADTVSDFRRDIQALRSVEPDENAIEPPAPTTEFTGEMEWDLPSQPISREADPEPVDPYVDTYPLIQELSSEVMVAPEKATPEPEPERTPDPLPAPVLAIAPPRPVAVPPAAPAPSFTPSALPVAGPSLASAFSALLAAEQVHPRLRGTAAPSTALSEEAVEEVVRRVVTRMTDEIVRKVVLETAERLIREEIERIKT
jgi:CheY-like chemotaxis protein